MKIFVSMLIAALIMGAFAGFIALLVKWPVAILVILVLGLFIFLTGVIYFELIERKQ